MKEQGYMTYLGIIIQYLEGVNPNFSSIMRHRKKGGDSMTKQEKKTLRELAILVSKEYERQQPKITFGEWLDQIKDDLEVVKR